MDVQIGAKLSSDYHPIVLLLLPAMTSALPYSPIAISMGDVCGIGPEIIALAYAAQPDLLRGCCVIGDAAIMRRALAEFRSVGIKTTIPFHQKVLNNPHFCSGDFDTQFIYKRMTPC